MLFLVKNFYAKLISIVMNRMLINKFINYTILRKLRKNKI